MKGTPPLSVAFLSDLHCDITPANRTLLGHLRDAVERVAPDVLALVGDLANDLDGWTEALESFSTLPCRKLVAPGNHDVWVESKTAVRQRKDSWWKHDVALSAAASRCDFHYLPGAPRVIDDVAFAGSLGWYDYSLRDPRLEQVYTMRDYDAGEFRDPRHRQGIWNDVTAAAWLRDPEASDWRRRRQESSAREVFEKLLALLQSDIRAIPDNARCLVALVHTNPFVECLSRGDEPDPFDAYEGSERIGRLLAEQARNRPVYCLCGHRHRKLDLRIHGVRVLRSPVGYLENFEGDHAELARNVVGTLMV